MSDEQRYDDARRRPHTYSEPAWFPWAFIAAAGLLCFVAGYLAGAL